MITLEPMQFWQSDYESLGQVWPGCRRYCLNMYRHHILLTPTQAATFRYTPNQTARSVAVYHFRVLPDRLQNSL